MTASFLDPVRDRVTREREFFLRLLRLAEREAPPESLLREALDLLVAMTGATLGYVELARPPMTTTASRRHAWGIASGVDVRGVDAARERLSLGIIAEAIERRQAIATHCARQDVRFARRVSVVDNLIDAVVCAPIAGRPWRGAIYLHGPAGGFDEQSVDAVKLFALHLSPVAATIMRRHEAVADRPRDVVARDGLIGNSLAFMSVLREVDVVCDIDINVVLTGESGTGKSELARQIHRASPRAHRPLIEVNCGALPETLIEGELFGSEAGAFTGARHRVGRVASSNGGTLFLDEIGELGIDAQAALLQLLSTKAFTPLGSTTPVTVDVRVIAATNVDLDRAVAAGRFREDLRYRLGHQIRVPSLRERRDDIPALARGLTRRACARFRRAELGLCPRLEQALCEHEWPGNIRQLAHQLEVAVARASHERAIRLELGHVFPSAERSSMDPDRPRPRSLREELTLARRRAAHQALIDNGWNIAAAARQLDVARSYLNQMIKRYSFERP